VGGDAGQHFGRVGGLRDVVDRSRLERAEFLLGHLHRGHEEDRNVRRLRTLLEALAGRDAVQAGHDQIDQDQVGRGVLQQRQRAAPTLRHEHIVAGLGQRVEEEGEIRGGVIDDEHASRGRRFHAAEGRSER
jgi:hypothetical protein